jgi:hypothetical protein
MVEIKPVGKKSAEIFDAIRDPRYSNFALVSSALDGENVDVIASVNRKDGDYLIQPLFVRVTDRIFKRLVEPSGKKYSEVVEK